MADEAKLPERPKDDVAADGDAGEGGEKLSKKALKKLEKEKEKAAKKAQLEQEAAQKKASEDANDVSKGHYGDCPKFGTTDYKPLDFKRYELFDLADVENETTALVRCQVANARKQGAKLTFLNFREEIDSIQAVVAESDTLSRQFVKFAANIPPESVVDVVGLVKDVPEPIKSATITGKELHVKQLWVVSRAAPQLPIQVTDAENALPSEEVSGEQQAAGGAPLVALSTRLDNRILDLRSSLNHAIFAIRFGVRAAFAEYLTQKRFVPIDTPKLIGSPSEGGANVFEVSYYKRKAYLAQSPQFYKQMMVAAGYRRVYEIADVYRAEDSNTSRHLSEYTSLDMEMAFYDSYTEVLDRIRELMHFILTSLQTKYPKETETVRQVYPREPFIIPAKAEDIPIIEFQEGIKWLNEAGTEADDGEDINAQAERKLGDIVREKFNTDVYILNGYPHKARAFYTYPRNGDLEAKYSNSFDFMMRGQEVLSGAQRIHDSEMLKAKMRLPWVGLDPENAGFKDYVDAFKYGCPPHGGGAFGLERIVTNWLGLPNVRLASLFPRDPSRVTP